MARSCPSNELAVLDNFGSTLHGTLGRNLAWMELQPETYGVFLVEPAAGGLDQLAFAQQAEGVFLALLEQFERQGRTVSPNPGRSYGPTVFATEPESMGINAAALKTAMARLLSANKIHVRKSGPPSRQRSHLAAGPSS
jgi:hypothetical protein